MKNSILRKVWALLTVTLLASSGWGFETDVNSKITGDLTVTGKIYKNGNNYSTDKTQNGYPMSHEGIHLHRGSDSGNGYCYVAKSASVHSLVAFSEKGKVDIDVVAVPGVPYKVVTNANNAAGSMDIIEFIMTDSSGNKRFFTAGCGVGPSFNDNPLYIFER